MASSQKKPHKAKPSKQHSLIRSEKNKKSGKYVRQRIRTDANKARRRAREAAKQARAAARRAARLEAAESDDETRDLGAVRA